MIRPAYSVLLLLVLVVGIPACGSVSFGFCTGWYCWGWNPYPPPCYPYPCRSATVAAVVDVDGDGHEDVIAGGPDSSALTLLRGNGQGLLVPFGGYPGTEEGGIDRLAHGDFDGDGDLDVAVVDATRDEVRLLHGDGTGFLDRGATFPLDLPEGLLDARAKDLDGDGRSDLVVVGKAGTVLRLLTGGASASLTVDFEATALGTGVTAVEVADLDGDGDADLVVLNELAETVEVWLGEQGMAFGDPIWSASTGPRPTALALAHLDTDGVPDVAVLDGLDGTLRVFFGDGDATFEASPQGTIDTGPYPGLALVPLPPVRGGKTTEDLVVVTRGSTNESTRLVGFESAADGMLERVGPAGTLVAAPAFAAGDLNEDGIPDLVVPGGDRHAIGVGVGGVRQD